MHPEVEEEIRKYARKYLTDVLTHQHFKPDLAVVEAGIISFDDIYFYGAAVAATDLALEHLVDMGQAPTVGDSDGVDQSNPDFRESVDKRGFACIAEIFKCTPKEAEERFWSIQIKKH